MEQFLIAAGFVLTAIISFTAGKLWKPLTGNDRPDTVSINCRVAGGPDHNHGFAQAFPADSEGFLGVMRNLAKFRHIESKLSIEFTPEPLITITRQKPTFLKPDAKERHGNEYEARDRR